MAALLIVAGLVALCCCRDAHESTAAQGGAVSVGSVLVDGARQQSTAFGVSDRPQSLDEGHLALPSRADGSVSDSEQCAPESSPVLIATPSRSLGDVLPAAVVGGASVQSTVRVGPLFAPASAGELPDSPSHLLCVMRT
ncbi:hypothetical protein [Pseudonocardia sp. WMMC193]|uniref:hypothetical protein n=1 Tax=Pseudonocardia sp. WMMC193 TaxID=2911965 RepID=UPI001F417CC2|nr:hypothetical protein [Pseudonocardia sp. WMMC193]MCF7552658.1 hypothetical protein [Pseudonocardia sp. WMMC193]